MKRAHWHWEIPLRSILRVAPLCSSPDRADMVVIGLNKVGNKQPDMEHNLTACTVMLVTAAKP